MCSFGVPFDRSINRSSLLITFKPASTGPVIDSISFDKICMHARCIRGCFFVCSAGNTNEDHEYVAWYDYLEYLAKAIEGGSWSHRFSPCFVSQFPVNGCE